jgi:peptidyl-prolyl cis-trans isomerase D
MAIIGRIQEKGRYLLVGFVGLALLTFIFSGLQKCETSTGEIPIGTIGGDDIDAAAYERNLKLAEQQDMMQYQQQGREYTDRDRDQSADRAWAATVSEILLQKEYDALGIEVSDQELDAYLYGEDGFPLLPDIARSFADSLTGQFNSAALDKFIESKENSKDPEEINQWKETKDGLRKQRMQEKYMQLIGQTVYVTKLEAKEEYKAQKEIKSVSFILRNFRDIKDEDIHIKDSEIRAFYDAHKDEKKYEVMAGRDVKYFDIAIQPSKKDSNTFYKELNVLKKAFAASTDDSMFVVTNTKSTVRYNKVANPYRMDSDPNAKGLTYPALMDTVFRAASVGQVVGPYDSQGKTYLAKVLGFNTQSLSARHILLPAQKTDAKGSAAQKKIADSLAVLLNADKTRFDEFVMTYSSDDGSKQKGGKYDDFAKDEFVPEFSDFVIANPVGKIGVVQSDFGFHIIEVLGKKDAKIPLMAVIEQTLEPSQITKDDLSNKAYDMLNRYQSKIAAKTDVLAKLSLFDTLARRDGYFARPVRILDESPKVTGFNTKNAEQKILALAYDPDVEVGMMCSSPIVDEGRYIIAMVASVREEKGAPTYEDAYNTMRLEAIKEKKANKYIAQIGKVRNLEKLAKKGNTQVASAEITFASPSIQGGGYEPEVVGSLFSGLKDGETTKPLIGNAGVYVIRINKTIKPATATNYDAERTQMLAQARGSMQSTLVSALQKRSEVLDNRALRMIGLTR